MPDETPWTAVLTGLWNLLRPDGPHDSAGLQARAQVRFAAGIGILSLVAAAAAFILYFYFSSVISTYESASACSSPGDALQGNRCRYEGQAQVLGTTKTDQLEATVEFRSVPGRTFTTRFVKNNEPSPALTAGATTDGELWSGKVTQLGRKQTADNPESRPAQPLLEFGVIFVVGALLIFGLAAGLASVTWRVK